MNPEQRLKIQLNFDVLVDQLIVDLIPDTLYSESVIEHDDLQRVYSEKTHRDKARRLIGILITRENSYDPFLREIEIVRPDLADKLKKTDVEEELKKRKESTEGGKESDSRVLYSDKELGRDRGKNILQREAAAKKMLTAEEEKIMDEAKYITLSRPSTAHLFSKGAQNQKEVLPSIVRAEVSKSVGLIYINGKVEGTGFRVGIKYILTCEHVIKNAKVTDQIIGIGRVSIEFGRISNTPNRDYSRIFGIISMAYVDKEHDFVVLELGAHDSGVPFPPALTCFGQVCWSDVHLVGHPNCTQMMEDSVIPFWLPEHNDIVMPYIDKLSSWSKIFFPGDIDHYKELRCLIPRKIIFHTTFNHGSSGSPGVMISEEKPCVVLMVRGGVPGCVYDNTYPDHTPFVLDNQKVEYGYAMEDIYKKMMNSSLEKYRNLASEIFKTWKC